MLTLFAALTLSLLLAAPAELTAERVTPRA